MVHYGDDISPMLTTSEVARILSIHINTVRRWSNQGVLRSYRIGTRGDRRYKREDINRFFSQDGGPKTRGPRDSRAAVQKRSKTARGEGG
jgi:excisionase family DNA binding protein